VFWSNDATSCLTAVSFPTATSLIKKMLPMESICTGSGNTKRASQQKKRHQNLIVIAGGATRF
jgi:hypothetical protein